MKPATGADLKAIGQQLAIQFAGPNWMPDILEKFMYFCEVRKDAGKPEFRMEEFRAVAELMGWPLPNSANAWGSLPKIAKGKGLIRWTEKYAPAISPKTHAHDVKIWIAL